MGEPRDITTLLDMLVNNDISLSPKSALAGESDSCRPRSKEDVSLHDKDDGMESFRRGTCGEATIGGAEKSNSSVPGDRMEAFLLGGGMGDN